MRLIYFAHLKMMLGRSRRSMALQGTAFGVGLLISGLLGGIGARSLAQTPPPSVLSPSREPLDIARLQAAETTAPTLDPQACREQTFVVTANTICQVGLTVPSLWWTRQQFDSKLVENWLAYPSSEGRSRRVDLIVNPQLWSLLSYFERYEVINHFGTTARGYNYNTRIFDRQGNALAAYTCDFGAADSRRRCDIWFNEIGLDSFRLRPSVP